MTWPAGAATGVGSLPGTDIVEACKQVFGEFTALPHLPELPARGPGADMIGRTGGLLEGMPVDLYAGRWRLAPRPGIDLRRTHDLLERDLQHLVPIHAIPLPIPAHPGGGADERVSRTFEHPSDRVRHKLHPCHSTIRPLGRYPNVCSGARTRS